MVISIPAQAEDSFGSPAAQAVEVLNSIAKSNQMQIEPLVSEIPSEMEGSISELSCRIRWSDVEMPCRSSSKRSCCGF